VVDFRAQMSVKTHVLAPMTPLAIPAWLARFWQACRIVRRFELTPRARVVDACAAVSVTSMARLRGSKDSQNLRGKKRLSGRPYAANSPSA
jgi:hypothetical protein